MDQFSTPQKTPIRSVLKEINSNEFINKSASGGNHGSVKSPLALESDISGIDADNTVSSGFDTTIDTSYKNENPNVTFGDLINGLGGLQLNTPQRLPKPSHNDGNNSVSSDDELFQECENGFDLDATTVNPQVTSSTVQAHSSNIDHNVFDKTINFSSITANSTASLQTTSDASLPIDRSDILSQTGVADRTINGESISSGYESLITNSNTIEVPSVESFAKSQEEVICGEELPAKIEIIINDHVESTTEKADVEQTVDTQSSEESTVSDDVSTKANDVINVTETPVVNGLIEPQKEKEEPPKEQPQFVDGLAGNDIVTESVVTEAENPNRLVKESLTNETPSPENAPEKLDKTIDISPNEKSTEVTPETPVEVSTSISLNPVENLNTTVDVTPQPTNDIIQNDDQSPTNINETVTEQAEAIQSEVLLNVTTDVDKKVEVEIDQGDSEKTPIQLNTTEIVSNEENPTETASSVEAPVQSANQTFEAMDVDMNETVDVQHPSTDVVYEKDQLLSASDTVEQTLFNQTVEMEDLDQADDVTQPPLNVTVDVSLTLNEQKPIQSPVVSTQQPEVKSNDNKNFNTTQILNIEPKSAPLLNQTIDMPNARMNVTPPIDQFNGVNETFVQSGSPNIFNQTHNVSKDFLSSTRHFEANNKNVNALPKVNLNETVVVDNKLPSTNTSFIVSPKSVDLQPIQMDKPIKTAPEQKENAFKLPAKPTKTTNPFDMKNQAQNQFDVSDDEFQSPGLILNSNDFDFLLSRGAPSGQTNPRDSILERFDPILGRKSIIPAPLVNKVESISIVAAPSVSTILEVDNSTTESVNSNESLVSAEKSPVAQPNVAINESVGDNKQIAKLESTEKLESNISGDGDNSLASSTTETYETASIGEPLKADVTMSVGLIHELKMDNMKSLEQDKVEPNLKMNDEHKVKQEMVGDIERKLKEAEAREETLLRRITEKEKALNKMSAVVENYEKTMVEMISEREQISQNYEKQLMQLKTERDANFHHLTSLENTFSDLHLKYEKSKQMALEVKDSEAKLVEKLEFCQQQMKLQEQRYDKLKNHALSQLEGANSKLEALSKAHSNEMKKLTAQLKKEEISRQSIMEQLAQKSKENEELVKICDELINNGADGS